MFILDVSNGFGHLPVNFFKSFLEDIEEVDFVVENSVFDRLLVEE